MGTERDSEAETEGGHLSAEALALEPSEREVVSRVVKQVNQLLAPTPFEKWIEDTLTPIAERKP